MRRADSFRTVSHPPGPDRGDPADDTPDLATRQSAFAATILDPDRPIPPGLVGLDGEAGQKRFSVYRNNVIAGLMETLGAAYPVVRRIVGDPFFFAMARIYASLEPPRSPIMLDYGAGFPDFVGAFEPAAALPYLRDVARLERAWVEAYHAAEAEPLDPTVLAAIAPERLARINLALHPSIRLVRSPFPIVALWRTNADGGVPTPLDVDGGGEDALIVRPDSEVEVRTLPAGAATLIDALAARAPIADAMRSALLEDPGFKLSDALIGLIEAGAIIGWSSDAKIDA